MNVLKSEVLKIATLVMSVVLSTFAYAADSTTKVDGNDTTSIDKLVANQPEKSSVPISQSESDKPLTINFSDFVKDGAGCGVPNLDTSSK
jgi:hypothetical protein